MLRLSFVIGLSAALSLEPVNACWHARQRRCAPVAVAACGLPACPVTACARQTETPVVPAGAWIDCCEKHGSAGVPAGCAGDLVATDVVVQSSSVPTSERSEPLVADRRVPATSLEPAATATAGSPVPRSVVRGESSRDDARSPAADEHVVPAAGSTVAEGAAPAADPVEPPAPLAVPPQARPVAEEPNIFEVVERHRAEQGVREPIDAGEATGPRPGPGATEPLPGATERPAGDVPPAPPEPSPDSPPPAPALGELPAGPAEPPEPSPSEPSVPEDAGSSETPAAAPVVPENVTDPAARTNAPVGGDPAAEIGSPPVGDGANGREPLRRWIDDTGSHAVVGRLVGGDAATVDILRLDGRRVLVPLERLSAFDRHYATAAARRLAERAVAAPVRDTAGL